MKITLFVYTFLVFLVFDALWLSLAVSKIYRPRIGHLLASDVSYWPAVVFYLLYCVGVVAFVLLPGVRSSGLGSIFVSGALLGLVAYGTYDLTNQATMKNWPLLVTVIDMIWGAVLTGGGSVLVTLVWRKIHG